MMQSGDIVTLGAGQYRLREQLAGSSYGLVWRAEREGFQVSERAILILEYFELVWPAG